MRTRNLLKLIGLSTWIAFAHAQGAAAASPAPKTEPTAEDASWLAAASAQKVVVNGSSLNGHNLNGRRANGTTLGGHTVRTDGGMTVVSIELPGGARHAK